MHFNKMQDILHVLNHFTYTMHNVCNIIFSCLCNLCAQKLQI